MNQLGNAKYPHRRWMRWIFLAVAVIGILDTPDAVMSAYHMYTTEHVFGIIIVVAFALRFGQIGLFLWLWWKFRPESSEHQPG